jgi:hypothetical protein
VAIGGGLAVDRAQQIEHLDDAFGAQVKCSATKADNLSSLITPVPAVFTVMFMGRATPMA